MDARDKALAAKSVQIDGSHYSIFRVNPLKASVVRLSNIGMEANVDQIGATCELFGRVKDVNAIAMALSTSTSNQPRRKTCQEFWPGEHLHIQ